MQPFEPLNYDSYYHIYNRGINGTNLFVKPDNYLFFLRQYDKYVEPIAETFAWCLMPNHFHLLVRIKAEEEILPLPYKPLSGHKATDKVNPTSPTLSEVIDPDSGLQEKKPTPDRQFSHLFNSYAQSFNKALNRHGGLFETPFDRIRITNAKYFTNLVHYIHNNPVHHGFCSFPADYPWSSYGIVISEKPTKLKRSKVLEWFSSKENFISIHKKAVDLNGIENILIE
jgi:putative transposase